MHPATPVQAPLIERDEFSDFFQRESHTLRPLNELDPGTGGLVIESKPALGPQRRVQQAEAFLVRRASGDTPARSANAPIRLF